MIILQDHEENYFAHAPHNDSVLLSPNVHDHSAFRIKPFLDCNLAKSNAIKAGDVIEIFHKEANAFVKAHIDKWPSPVMPGNKVKAGSESPMSPAKQNEQSILKFIASNEILSSHASQFWQIEIVSDSLIEYDGMIENAVISPDTFFRFRHLLTGYYIGIDDAGQLCHVNSVDQGMLSENTIFQCSYLRFGTVFRIHITLISINTTFSYKFC
jgi:hypothetical protein